MRLFNLFVKITAFPFVFPFLKWKIYGKENLSDAGATVIVSKHTSFWDVFLYQYLFFKKKIIFPATTNAFGNGKLADSVFFALGARPIDNSGRGVNGIDHILDESDGNILCVFPEGRISKDILPFHAGAFYIAKELERDLLPVYIDGNYGLFHRVKISVGEKFGFVRDENGINLFETIRVAEEKMKKLKNIAKEDKN